MHGLQKNLWINFDGEPITGNTPPRMIVYGQLTGPQWAGVANAYRMFSLANLVALGEYQSRRRTLSDGTKVRLVSINGVDTVEVWPPDTEEDQGVVGGFAFWRWQDRTKADLSSRLGLKYTIANDRVDIDKIKYYPTADENYGMSRWYGGSTLRTLSWEAKTVDMLVFGHATPSELGRHQTLAVGRGYSTAYSLGTSTEVYHKSRVVLNLSNPNLVDESKSELVIPEGELAASTVQGCAIYGDHLYAIVATGLPGEAVEIRSVLDFGQFTTKLLYKIRILRFSARFVKIQGRTELRVSERFEVLHCMDDEWMQDKAQEARDLRKEQYPEATVYAYRPGLLNPYPAWLPVQCWSFNTTGNKAVCLFHDADFVEDNHVVLEFDVDLEAVKVKYAAIGTTSPAGWVRYAGSATIRDNLAGPRTFDQTFTGTESPVTAGNLTHIREEMTYGGGGNRVDQVEPFLLHVGFDGDEYVNAELVVSEVNQSGSALYEVWRSISSTDGAKFDTDDYHSRTETTARVTNDLVFRKNGNEFCRFSWYELSGTLIRERNKETTFVTANAPGKRWPGRVLYIDAVSQSAAWVEVQIQERYLSEYETPLGVINYTDGWSTYDKYNILPEKISVKYVLRSIANGEERPAEVLRTEERFITEALAKPVSGVEFAIYGAYPKDEAPPSNGWYTDEPVAALFSSNYLVEAAPYLFDVSATFGQDVLPHSACGSDYASTANYAETTLSSIDPNQLEVVPILTLPAAPLGPPVNVSVPSVKPVVITNTPEILEPVKPGAGEEFGFMDSSESWLGKLSIF